MSAAARRGTCPASTLMCARGRTSLFALIVLLGAQCGRRAEDGARACSLALAFTCALGRTSLSSTTETTRELVPPETHEETPRRIRGWVDEWGLLEGAGSWGGGGGGGGGSLGGETTRAGPSVKGRWNMVIAPSVVLVTPDGGEGEGGRGEGGEGGRGEGCAGGMHGDG
jgi:hypothetical protein